MTSDSVDRDLTQRLTAAIHTNPESDYHGCLHFEDGEPECVYKIRIMPWLVPFIAAEVARTRQAALREAVAAVQVVMTDRHYYIPEIKRVIAAVSGLLHKEQPQ